MTTRMTDDEFTLFFVDLAGDERALIDEARRARAAEAAGLEREKALAVALTHARYGGHAFDRSCTDCALIDAALREAGAE